jgi:hypothetical protein
MVLGANASKSGSLCAELLWQQHCESIPGGALVGAEVETSSRRLQPSQEIWKQACGS